MSASGSWSSSLRKLGLEHQDLSFHIFRADNLRKLNEDYVNLITREYVHRTLLLG